MCLKMLHMTEMLLHITAVHKDEDVDYWTAQCSARLALYKQVVGVPLTSPSSTPQTQRSTLARVAAVKVGDAPPLDGEAALGEETLRALAPTITASGAYICNWCTVKRAPFATRDAFLLHVAKSHPKLDFDEVETLVPLCTAASPSPQQPAAASATAWEPAEAALAARGLPSKPATAVPLVPSRRMAGVKTVVEDDMVAIPMAPLQTGVSVPGGERYRTREPPSIASAADGGDTTAAAAALPFFREGHFPCELCTRVFSTENNLLQHLEGKHAPPPVPIKDDDGSLPIAKVDIRTLSSSTAAAASDKDASEEKSGAKPSTISVACDLCKTSSKIFTLPSALFAHIRFRHRTVDATYEAERMMQQQRNRIVFSCPHCDFKTLNAVRLQTHLWSSHAKRVEVKQLLGMESSESAVDDAAALPAEASASPTLPVFRIKERWWCDECECGFCTPGGLGCHQREKHDAVAQLFPCPACKRVFTTSPHLEQHVKLMHKGMQLADLGVSVTCECPHCKRGFLSQDALHKHCVRHHGKDPNSGVRAFAGPDKKVETQQQPVDSAAAASDAAPAETLAAPQKPRKVSRAKKAAPTGA